MSGRKAGGRDDVDRDGGRRVVVEICTYDVVVDGINRNHAYKNTRSHHCFFSFANTLNNRSSLHPYQKKKHPSSDPPRRSTCTDASPLCSSVAQKAELRIGQEEGKGTRRSRPGSSFEEHDVGEEGRMLDFTLRSVRVEHEGRIYLVISFFLIYQESRV